MISWILKLDRSSETETTEVTRMMRWRRWVSAMLVASAFLCMTAQSAFAQEPVVIRMMAFDRAEERAWQEAVVEEFHKEQDRIRIELISGAGEAAVHKAIALVAAGIPPHIAYGDPEHSASWGRQGIALDLEPLFQRDYENSPFKDFYPGALALHSMPGKRYGIPVDLQVQAFFYAEVPFDEAGLAYPDETWTWDRVAEVAPHLTLDRDGDGTIERWAMRDPQYISWWSLLWHFGGRFVDHPSEPTRFTGDTAEMRNGMEWIHRMIHEIRGMPLFDALSGQTAQNLVMDQNIAMAVGNSLYLQQTLQYTSEVPWNIVPLPSGPYGNTSYSNAIGWSIFQAAGDIEEAWEVVKYFSSEKAMRMSVEMRGTLVPHLGVVRDYWLNQYENPSGRSYLIDAIATAEPLPVIYGNAWGSIYRNTRNYWNGRITLNQAIENMRVDITNWLAEIRTE